MAFPGTRQFSMFEEDPGFNLGMNADAFRNLGINIPGEPGGGLMSLQGANTTVANPAVVEQIQSAVPQGLTIQDLYTKALGREYDPGGLEYWTGKIGPTAEGSEIEEFLRVAQPELAQTKFTPFSGAMLDTGAQEKSVIPGSDIEGPGTKEVVDDFTRVVDDRSSTVGAEQANVIPGGPANLEARTVTDTGQTQTQKAVDTSNFPKFEGKPYDPAAYDNILKQLTAQSQVLQQQFKVPYSSTFGGAQETVQDLAKRLAAMGLSDISELGMKHELPVEKVYETIPGEEGGSMTFDTGKYQTISGFKGYDAERNPIFEYRELTPDEVKKLQFDKTGFAFLPSGMIDRKELANTPYATTKYYNKKTGQEIDTRQFGGKAESGLFASSGAGEGYTNYRVMYDKDGNPVFIPEKQLSGMKDFVVNTLPGLLSVASIIPGAAPFVTAAQVAGGLAAGADPGKLLESVGRSLIASNIGNLLPAGLQEIGLLDKPIWDDYLGKFVGGTPTTDLGKLALSAGSSGLSSLIRGGDLESALKSAALSTVGTGISSLLPKGKIGDFDYGQLLTTLAPALADGKLSNADIFRLVNLYAKQEAKQGKTPGKP